MAFIFLYLRLFHPFNFFLKEKKNSVNKENDEALGNKWQGLHPHILDSRYTTRLYFYYQGYAKDNMYIYLYL